MPTENNCSLFQVLWCIRYYHWIRMVKSFYMQCLWLRADFGLLGKINPKTLTDLLDCCNYRNVYMWFQKFHLWTLTWITYVTPLITLLASFTDSRKRRDPTPTVPDIPIFWQVFCVLRGFSLCTNTGAT